MTHVFISLPAVAAAAFVHITLLGGAVAGPARVGNALPPAKLRTAEGQEFDLAAAVREQPAVIIFYRGSWCPYCTKHLSGLSGIEKDLVAAGFQLLAISPDQPSALREKPEYQAFNYRLLSDSKAKTARAFGLAFQVADDLVAKYKNEYSIDIEAASGETHHLLPHPAVFVVDKSGVIRFAHVNENYKVRLEPAKVLEAAKDAVTK